MQKRSKELQEAYDKVPKTSDFVKTNKVIKDFKHWRIIENEYPWDLIADTHHLLVPKRKVQLFTDLSFEEVREFQHIIELGGNNFDEFVIKATPQRSVADYLHIHLIKYKND